jgi:hypothetical protein
VRFILAGREREREGHNKNRVEHQLHQKCCYHAICLLLHATCIKNIGEEESAVFEEVVFAARMVVLCCAVNGTILIHMFAISRNKKKFNSKDGAQE